MTMRDHVTAEERLRMNPLRSAGRRILRAISRRRHLHIGKPRLVREYDGLLYIRFRGTTHH